MIPKTLFPSKTPHHMFNSKQIAYLDVNWKKMLISWKIQAYGVIFLKKPFFSQLLPKLSELKKRKS